MAREITVPAAMATYLHRHREVLEWEARLRTIPPEAPALRQAVARKAAETHERMAHAYAVFVSALSVRCYDDATDPFDPEHRDTADAALGALERIVKEGAR